MKQKTLIAYQDGRPDLERTAKVVQDRLGSEDREIVMKPVSGITVPELLAAGFFVFGADEVESAHFTDLARILGGINLAGRKVAYFGASGAAVAWLKAMAADSELAQAGSDLVGPKPEPSAIAAWIRSFS